jgi:DNA-binding NtrC family response regulator
MAELAGLRVLIVEDEAGVALLLEDMLLELGCNVIGSIARVDRACEVAAAIDCDFAVLDVNLGGTPVFPVAHILQGRRIPFVFSTGYGPGGIVEAFKDRPVLSKPFPIEALKRSMELALGSERK